MKARRAGYSLVECLVVMSLIGFTLGTVSVTLHGLRRADRRVRDELAQEVRVESLVHQLRRDAHLATKALLVPANEATPTQRTLLLTVGSDRTVEYSLVSNDVVRTLREDDKVSHRDSYQIESAASGYWQIHSASERPLITLWLPLPMQGAAKPSMYRICAVANLPNQ